MGMGGGCRVYRDMKGFVEFRALGFIGFGILFVCVCVCWGPKP